MKHFIREDADKARIWREIRLFHVGGYFPRVGSTWTVNEDAALADR